MKRLVAVFLSMLSLLAHAQTVPVLIYHRVTTELPASQTVISPRMFTQHVDRLQRLGMNTITVAQLEAHLRAGAALPPNPILLTFDDGWKDNIAAARTLSERGMTATFYLMSGTFDNHLYVTRAEARHLAEKHEIGAHSHTHFMEWVNDMSKVDDRIMLGEIAMSKAILEQTIGKPVTSFAWPFGYYREHLLTKLPSLGFTSSMHVNSESLNQRGMSPLRIQRLNIDGACNADDLEQMIRTGKIKECR